MNADPSVAVIVPVFNQAPRTVRFLEQFRAVRYSNYRLIVVDDGSTDGTAARLARDFPTVVVLRGNGKLWWAGATNLGVRHALALGFDYVLTINHDTRVSPTFLGHLVETAQGRPQVIVGSRIHFAAEPRRVWAVGCTMDWSAGLLFHLAGHGLPENAVLARGCEPWPVPALTGCGTLVPTACFRVVGFYDAVSYPQYHADTEFILRARRFGYRALVDPRAVIWNDAANTVANTVSRYVDFLFSPRSPVYWRPLLAIHRQYCPPRLVLPSLLRHYARFFRYHDPALRFLKQLIRPALNRCFALSHRLPPRS